jgi:sugar phosphate permease
MAFGIGQIHSGIPMWKWLFLIEAMPCFFLGLFCLYWLPDRPLQNNRFSGTDQKIAEARFHQEANEEDDGLHLRQVIATLKDWKLYAQAAVYLPTAAIISSIAGFLPTIVQDMGYTAPATANLMTVPPYAIAFMVMYLASQISDRLLLRGPPITILLLVSAAAYAVLASLPSTPSKQPAKYASMCIAVTTVYATYPLTHAWPANNFGNETKRAVGLGVYTAIGNLGSIAGTWFYPAGDAPQFRRGHWLCVGMALAGAAFAAGNSLLLAVANRGRERMAERADEDPHRDGDERVEGSKKFRYIL